MDVLAGHSKNGAHKIAGQDFYCKEHAELSQKVMSIVPEGFKAFFINSGAEAVENAIKIAYRKTSKETPSTLPGISCINAFHGRTLGALSFTFSKPVQKTRFPQLPVLRIKFCTSDGDPEVDAAEKLLRLQHCKPQVHPNTTEMRRQAWRTAHSGRSAVRHGAHGQMVGI
jgi:4-aminobutyrate aminotransferase